MENNKNALTISDYTKGLIVSKKQLEDIESYCELIINDMGATEDDFKPLFDAFHHLGAQMDIFIGSNIGRTLRENNYAKM